MNVMNVGAHPFRSLNAKAGTYASRIAGNRRALRPAHVTIEPTNACNSRCLMCLPYRRNSQLDQPETGFVTWEVLKATEPALRYAKRLLLTGFGEPLMHPEYAEIVRWGKERVPYVYMFTNGIPMSPEMADSLVSAGIDQVNFSVGGSCESVQQHIRGVDLKSLVDGIQNLVSAKSSSQLPEIRFNIVAMNSVLDDFAGIVELARDFGVKHIDLPQMWAESDAAIDESPLNDSQFAKRLEEVVALGSACGVAVTVWDYPPAPHRCKAPFDSFWVAWNGDVYSCQFERYVMGNVLEGGAERLWRSSAFGELRSRVSSCPVDVCPNCPLVVGTADSYLNPSLHGRTVAPRFGADGPEHIETRRVMGDRSLPGSHQS